MSEPKATVKDLEVVVIAQAKQIDDLIIEQDQQFKEIGLLLSLVNQLAGVVLEMCKNHPEYTDASKRPEIECEFCEKQHDDFLEHIQVVAEEIEATDKAPGVRTST